MQLLISRRADPALRNAYGQTPLHLAAERGNLAVVRLLLGAGTSLEAYDQHGTAAIHLAAANGHAATVALLLDMGANADQAVIHA